MTHANAYLDRMQRLFLLGLTSLAMPSWSLSQTFHVLGHPHLNLRETAVDGRVIEAVGYGESVEFTGKSFAQDTINGLSGTWVEVRWSPEAYPQQMGVVFDAYLWPGDVPKAYDDVAHKPGESAETFREFGLRTVDGVDIRLFGECSEDYGGPSSDEVYLEVVCTAGQAMALFRLWLKRWFGVDYANGRLNEEEKDRYETIMTRGWPDESEQPVWFGRSSEGGGSTWSVQRVNSAHSTTFRFSFSQGSC
jgi:hypothetical protein